MSDYSIDMFSKDHDEMLPILKLLDKVEIPEEECPKFRIGRDIFSLNPNDRTGDTLGFFVTKYGRAKGRDYGFRFLNVMWFIEENKGALIKKRLVKVGANKRTIIRDELLQVLLSSFIPPKPPVIFPTTSLRDKDDKYNEFSLPKVLEAVKPLMKD